MFTVVRMKDAIPIPASELDKPRQLAVANQIEEKYCNRVIIDVGLCICLFEICDLGDSLMYQSDSAVHVRAEFTLVVFRPFIGEVLTGSIAKATAEGLWLSVGFFEDIFVPPHFMQDGTEWDPELGMWVWKSEHGAAYLDPRHGSVIFRVTNSKFRQVKPPSRAPPAAEAERKSDVELREEDPPFTVMASIKDDGLGLVIWWGGGLGEEAAEEEEEGEEEGGVEERVTAMVEE